MFKYVLIDIFGQIEVFIWLVFGIIIIEVFVFLFLIVVIYVMDILRSINLVIFMFNMFYVCSILYKIKLFFIVVMNKIDIIDYSFVVEWMQDFEVF